MHNRRWFSADLSECEEWGTRSKNQNNDIQWNEWVNLMLNGRSNVLYIPKTPYFHSRPSNCVRFQNVRASLAPTKLKELHFHSVLGLSVKRKWSNHYFNSHKLNFDKALWYFQEYCNWSYLNKRPEKQNKRLITLYQIQVLILSHFPFCLSSPACLSYSPFHRETQQTSVKAWNTWHRYN